MISLKQDPGAAKSEKASNGGTVWNCSKVLTKYLESQSEDMMNKMVVEIGAGTGFNLFDLSLLSEICCLRLV